MKTVRMALFAFLVCSTWFLAPVPSMAQDAVPSEILGRTVFLKVGDDTGTGFKIDYKGRLYYVDARHVIASNLEKHTPIEIKEGSDWRVLAFNRIILPSSPDVDIAVIAGDEKVEAAPFSIRTAPETDGRLTLGQQVWFIGYPFEGIVTRTVGGQTLPFIKRGILSAIDASHPDAIVLYVDGFNNPGFSGGPIVFWNFKQGTYQIAGVVMGYREDTALVLINGEPVKTNILVNSGIMIGYHIRHALDAIDRDLQLR